ncbi:cobyrinate a,c-diamide synthase [Thermanaeromonas sp. C210]|uniref:cobyrinate a,c-diamide synthase n=1 Tax=Thermanaeromonas sp. C210 TaxID=2731925 RepID=UPI00155CA4EC|nr:cobyrinate a,c-diamide synthase [Thermanaeromonas sp. C210]GFN23247.1 cobyrinate a,c-diamide synthase [Thermanaeromonas sp. C210]
MTSGRDIPRVVLAAPHGRSGKTILTLGLVAALVKRGLRVQPFKKGPDFIDPSWLSLAAGRPCRNLDLYFVSPQELRRLFVWGCREADVAVIEGAMGLFDGLDMKGSGSTAEIALALEAPVLLVVDTTRMTRSVAALVRGFQDFDSRLRLSGVILNRVARPRHENMLRRAIEEYTDLPVLGALPKDDAYLIPDRHLGLIPAAEREDLHRALEATRAAVEGAVDVDRIWDIARTARPVPGEGVPGYSAPQRGVSLGVIKDRVFHFYYPENLEALVGAGARLVLVDSLKDSCLPAVDGLYIGGGFPEVFAAELEANAALRRSIRRAAEEGLPIYAECGGLIYLARRLYLDGKVFEMVGALPLDVQLEKKPQGHGYTLLEARPGNPFFSPGSRVKGHEFHHSRVINLEREKIGFAYRVLRGNGVEDGFDGILYRQILASYNHLYAPAHHEWIPRFVARMSGEVRVTANLGS